MSSIEKLSIRGIRSFSPNREETVEFYHPLTVILGDNGSGKTSIIESLKIACTGSLPPGARSGQSFIHDPRIAGTNEVKASVRLRFRNRAGKPMVVQRTFQLTQQKSKTQYKALDGAIRVVNDLGERVSMSHKCAELDRHIPEMLGVSKAILESVIFCHQEESNWPLADAGTLKKRFDDIFESARYTKALEAITKLKKARASDAKDYKRDLDVLNVKLKSAEEIRTKIERTQERIQQMNEDAADMDGKVNTATETFNDMKVLLAEITAEHAALERLHSDASLKEDSIQCALKNIDEMMSDTDEELEMLLRNYDSIVEEHQHVLQKLEDQASQLQKDRSRAQKRYTELCTDKGSVQARIDDQEKHVTDLVNFAGDMGRKYQFYTQALSSQDDAIRSFQAKFQHFINEKRRQLEQVEKENKQRLAALNTELADVKSKHHHAKEQLKEKQNDRGSLNVEKRANAQRLKDLSANGVPSSRDVDEADKMIQEATDSLDAFTKQNDIFAIKSEIDSINKQLNDANYDAGQLDEKIKLLRAYESKRFTIEAMRKEVVEKESVFQDKLTDTAVEHRAAWSGEEPTDEASLVTIVNALKDLVSEQTNSLTGLKEDVSRAEQKLHENIASTKLTESASTALQREKRELELGPIGQLKRLVEEITPGADLHSAEEVLQKSEKAYLAAKDKTMRCKNTITFLSVFKKKGMEEKCCPLCTRGMTPAEEELFMKTIDEKTDDRKVKDKIKKAETAEESAQKKWKEIEATMLSWRKWKSMEHQITTKSNELNSLFAAKRSLQADVKDKKTRFESAELQIREEEDAMRAFQALVSLAGEVRRLRAKLSNEQDTLRKNEIEVLGANAPSLSELETLREENTAKVQELTRLLQRKQNESGRTQDLQNQLQNDLHKRKEEKVELDKQRKEYERASEEQIRLRDREKALHDQINALNNAAPQLEEDVRSKAAELQSLEKNLSAVAKQAKQEEQECARDLTRFEDKMRKVEDQANLKLDKQLTRLAEEIAQAQQMEVNAHQALEEMTPQIATARLYLSGQETFKRKIRDNMDFRRLKRDLEEIHEHIVNAQQKISTLPSLDDVTRRFDAAEETLESAKEERSTLNGRLLGMKDQIRDEKIKLKSSEYRGIEERHRQKLIQHETTLMAVSDLDKYFKALDKSLLQYHQKKIEEINTIIKSLWQITYKGQDIDTIELLSGQDLDTGGTKAARSYDYRVVMKKGGALIDMRGRCSAGQKVLAGLVIRLALAETFCLNCGILTLDEPTTNLDTENKFGLAQAITDILNARSAQQNFQLVCITHDEEFVQMLSEAQGMDGSRPEYYWRVSREDIGNNRFCSKIERREWRDGI